MRPELEALARNARTFPGLRFDAAGEALRCREGGVEVLCGDALPGMLTVLPDAPEVLYVRGKKPDTARAVAIVGSRRPTPYGRRFARRLAQDCVKHGIVVVSGLAAGIDAEAHRGALEAGGRTWAVLGSGLDQVYPRENAALAEAITASGGALISEAPLGLGPAPELFPRRNRIVSGLSWAVVVVEGAERSGTLITARLAAEQGREVFAVPGPVDSSMSAAPNRLLRDGARALRGIADLLEDLPLLASL